MHERLSKIDSFPGNAVVCLAVIGRPLPVTRIESIGMESLKKPFSKVLEDLTDEGQTKIRTCAKDLLSEFGW